MPDGQIIVVEYNGRYNAFEGERNKHNILTIENKLDIQPMIELQLKTLTKGGYLLIKYSGILYICEKDNVDPSRPYRKHVVKYHPYAKEFTI